MENTKEKKNKKSLILLVLALLISFAMVSGTVAWLTRTSKITNSFTVGTFEVPTTDPEDATQTISIDGHLYEPSWDANAPHKLLPGITFEKDPYVGIGAGSEDAVVYVYVENNFSNKVYFTINSGWEAVADNKTAGSKEGTYTSGLFKYTAGLTGSADADSWTTTPLFSEINADDTADSEDFTVAAGVNEIVVSSFIHQAKDDEGNAINEATILEAAKAAFGI